MRRRDHEAIARAAFELFLERIGDLAWPAHHRVVNAPKGNLDGPRLDYMLATNDQLGKAESFRPLIIAYKSGSPVRLDDVSDVLDGVENAQLAGWAGRPRSIILNDPRAIEALPRELRDKTVVTFCTCPNEASAAFIADLLLKAGYRNVRVLTGGTDALDALTGKAA